jgi:hypothetical protein
LVFEVEHMRRSSLIVNRNIQVLMGFALAFAFCLVVSPVLADPVPYPGSETPQWIAYGLEVMFGEAIAWVVGAEFLFRLTRKTMGHKKDEVSRYDVYKIMLLAMLLSFIIGVLLWKIYGWL